MANPTFPVFSSLKKKGLVPLLKCYLWTKQPAHQISCVEIKNALMRDGKATVEGVTLCLSSRNKQGFEHPLKP